LHQDRSRVWAFLIHRNPTRDKGQQLSVDQKECSPYIQKIDSSKIENLRSTVAMQQTTPKAARSMSAVKIAVKLKKILHLKEVETELIIILSGSTIANSKGTCRFAYSILEAVLKIYQDICMLIVKAFHFAFIELVETSIIKEIIPGSQEIHMGECKAVH